MVKTKKTTEGNHNNLSEKSYGAYFAFCGRNPRRQMQRMQG